MAHLLTALAVSGAYDSTGAPVSSGNAWFFVPGSTSSQSTVYSDPDGLYALTQPVPLDAAGRATVYTKGTVRVLVEDASGVEVETWDRENSVNAAEVEVENAGWTGTVLSGNQAGSTAAGGRTNLDTVLSRMYASLGGTDGKYQNSASGTARSIKDKFSELCISVKDYGAQGDGLTVDTTAIQAAINRVAALGGGIVYFPPGTYLIDQALTNASANGVSVAGSGRASTVLKFTNAVSNGLTWSFTNGFFFENFSISHTSTSNAAGISITHCDVFRITSVECISVFSKALSLSLTANSGEIGASFFQSTANAGDRGVLISGTGNMRITGSLLAGKEADVEVTGTCALAIDGCVWNGSTAAVKTSAACKVTVTNSPNGIAYATPFVLSSTPAYFFQTGNRIALNVTTPVAIGGTTAAPDWSKGWLQKFSATSGGAGTVTVPAPTPPTAYDDTLLTLIFVNASGGAVTWSAAWLKTAAIPTTDGHTITVVARYDGASVWRAVSLVDTTT